MPREADEGDSSVTEFLDVEALAGTASLAAFKKLCSQLGKARL